MGICLRILFYFFYFFKTSYSDGSIRHWRIESRGTKKYLQQLKQHYDIHKNSIDNMDATSQHIISTCENMIKVKIKNYNNTMLL